MRLKNIVVCVFAGILFAVAAVLPAQGRGARTVLYVEDCEILSSNARTLAEAGYYGQERLLGSQIKEFFISWLEQEGDVFKVYDESRQEAVNQRGAADIRSGRSDFARTDNVGFLVRLSVSRLAGGGSHFALTLDVSVLAATTGEAKFRYSVSGGGSSLGKALEATTPKVIRYLYRVLGGMNSEVSEVKKGKVRFTVPTKSGIGPGDLWLVYEEGKPVKSRRRKSFVPIRNYAVLKISTLTPSRGRNGDRLYIAECDVIRGKAALVRAGDLVDSIEAADLKGLILETAR